MTTQDAIIDFIGRHTLVIERCLPMQGRGNAMSTIQRLVRARQLTEWRHKSGIHYWTLQSRTPLADHSLIRSLGILLFCFHSQSRTLLTRNEIQTYFPGLFRHGLPAGHYVDRNSQSVILGHVRVDATPAKINRIVSRTVRLTQKYRQQSGFRRVIDEGRFELTWIVSTNAKQRRLLEALRPLSGSGIRSRVCVIPELLNIIAPIQAA